MNRETKLDIIELTRGYLGAFVLMFIAWKGWIML